jgi:acetate kinase
MTMPDQILVINAGSSSLKYQLVDPGSGAVAASGLIEQIGEVGAGSRRHVVAGREHHRDGAIADASAAFEAMIAAFAENGPDLSTAPPLAVGHRVVHGGSEFAEATLVDAGVLDRIRRLSTLAPLHNPANLAGIELAMRTFGTVPQVAVFDTAFHRTLPAAAQTYAVPRRWREDLAVRRYGFHGTSHRYVSARAIELLGGAAGLGIVVLHLGNGCSACAVLDGRSVETSMGLTPLEGLVMGTRSGDIDPSIGGHLARTAGLTAGQVEDALNHDCGLAGLTGDSDFRAVVQRAGAGDPYCRLALDVVTHRIVKYVGGYAAVMGRLDAVVFTGGIGENDPGVRTSVLRRLAIFGAEVDADTSASGERVITAEGSRVVGLVIPTNEELQIARECRAVLS